MTGNQNAQAAYSRIIRDIKRSIFGTESYLNTEDRRVLEQVIFPYFLPIESGSRT
jgi:hypothetical protein